MHFDKQRSFIGWFLYIALPIISGCTILGTGVGTVDEPKGEKGIRLYPAAIELKGLGVDDICTFSKQCVILSKRCWKRRSS